MTRAANPADPDTALDRWSAYWRTGQLHSCPMAYPGNYAGEIAEAWHRFFAGLPARARVLDIGTGNGAIAYLACDFSARNRREFAVTGIDAAQIDPAAAAARQGIDMSGIQFRGGTPAERTGFATGSFDAICGQYALEYTDVSACAAELQRLTTSGSQLQFVTHHAESRVAITAAAELDHLRYALERHAIIDCARQMLSHIATVPEHERPTRLPADPRAEELRMALNRTSGVISDRIRDGSNVDVLREILGQIATIFQSLKQRPTGELLQALDRMETGLRLAQTRLHDLLQASQSPQQIAGIAEALRSRGFAVQEPTVLQLQSGDIMGWILRGTRR